ncbi:acyl--CoA ligase [Kroppenstedtia pulmonis]|uniref:Acyl--CoA ligase n=1 Tax=Kroppenstedtia pulmonis TaxID=1380685 RepID=A0A7D3Y1W4_9BACL|nr:class I adenylate-forming enzyme family protein [Kroppenstedtia pulmonis]QKG84483.1 acyl--CoA ligase [Kroppenstedtia pulmonis]
MQHSDRESRIFSEGKIITFRNFNRDVLEYAEELRQKGVCSGEDRVLLKSHNSYSYCVALFSLMHLNLSVVLVDTQLKLEDVEKILSTTDAKWVLTDDLPALFKDECRVIPLPKPEVFDSEIDFNDKIDLKDWEKRRDAVILYSSGSTGEPKGIVKSGSSVMDNAKDTVWAMGYKNDDVFLPLVPFSHVWGFSLLINWWLTNCSLMIRSYASLSSILKPLVSNKVTVVDASPSTLFLLLQHLKKKPEILSKVRDSSVRMWCTGGGLVTQKLKEDFLYHMGRPLLDGYGSSEMGNISMGSVYDSVGCGPLIPNVQVKVLSSEKMELPLGEVGEIFVKTSGMMEGYLVAPYEYCMDLEDGWFSMKDLGYLDEENHLYILGRKDQAINRMGYTFYPAHIEKQVESLGFEAKVITVADEKKGMLLVLFVGSPEKNTATVRREVLKLLPSYMYPDKLICMEKLPCTSGGIHKINRRELEKIIFREMQTSG